MLVHLSYGSHARQGIALRGQGLMPWGSAVFEEKKVAVTLGDGVGGKAGGRDGGGETGGFIVEEALDGAEVVADLGAAGAGAGVLEGPHGPLSLPVPRSLEGFVGDRATSYGSACGARGWRGPAVRRRYG